MLFCKYHLFYLFNGFYVSSWIGLKLKGMAFCVLYRIIRYNILNGIKENTLEQLETAKTLFGEYFNTVYLN